VVAQVILADEINRTPPKTQAALLQAMQEGEVTVGGETRPLPRPFYVLATRNPIEHEGTYPLPEAQLDRFMLDIKVEYPPAEDEAKVLAATTAAPRTPPEPVLTAAEILDFQQLVRRVPLPDGVLRRTVALLRRTRPGPDAPAYVNQWVKWGAGPRAGQHLILAAKAAALLRTSFAVTLDEIERLARPVLRHRLVMSFVAEAEGVTADDVIGRLVAETLA